MTDQFEAFHARVMADPALQRRLDCGILPEDFATAVEVAAAGWEIPPDQLRPGVRRPSPAFALHREWAPPGWLPAQIHESEQGPIVDWAYFGDRLLDDSFYHDAVARAVARPFNRLFRHATRLDDLIACTRPHEAARLAGFVFHMSRCGSTLVSQMFAALPGTVSLSEPGPLDAVVRLAIRAEIPRERAIAAMRAIVAALTRRRGGELRAVIKLDSWHILALPLFRAAFPNVPWVYLFREPVEVLVSHMRMRGYQTVPEVMPAGLYALDGVSPAEPEQLCARILTQFHQAAFFALQAGEGLAVDYAECPDAVAARIAPHFGIDLSEMQRSAMASVSDRNAKARDLPFSPDAVEKREEASDAIRVAVHGSLARLHEQLAGIQCVGGSSRADR
ncbi:hypothetical protein ACMGDH_09305 [Sphingomonas sp. DT-207]|uniref:hypothetical protein n=1 Tax=Sphingomonas sp. DT-207 TaxID=3396167 RepID=UPI003F1B24F2